MNSTVIIAIGKIDLRVKVGGGQRYSHDLKVSFRNYSLTTKGKNDFMVEKLGRHRLFFFFY